jgi:ammonium transporter, Amt family
MDPILINNLWVIIAALLVFIMTIAVGFLEFGELGTDMSRSIFKTVIITGSAIFFMALIGFNIAFAPTLFHGLIGNPFYGAGLLLGGFSGASQGLLTGVWWSMASNYFNTGLTTGTYFLFEAAFASVTLALVSVVVLKKMKLSSFAIYSAVYFIIIWTLPAAWIWNPTGWLFQMGMRDFAGGLVVHGAAAAAGLGVMYQIWREERAKGLKKSPQTPIKLNQGWLALGILLLWIGWFGFNPGSVLAFNSSAMTVVITTFLAAATAMISTMVFSRIAGQATDLMSAVNGILMGLIIITPLAGFVSPASALILGLLGGPIFVYGSIWFGKRRWFSDPVGLLPGHMVGGLFGVLMIAFFTQGAFAAASGNPTLPNGLLFGGGMAALTQLGIEAFGIIVVMATVFVLSYLTCAIIAAASSGITTSYGTARRRAR